MEYQRRKKMADAIYLMRFNLKQEQLEAVFNETEIAKRFEEVMEENKELISNQVAELRTDLSSFFEDEKFKSLVLDEKVKKFESRIWDDEYVISEIMGNTKDKILRLAINEVFVGSFDVKQNILDILKSDGRVQDILRERVKAMLEVFKEPRISKLSFLKLNEDIDEAIAEFNRNLDEEIKEKLKARH